MMDNNRLSKTQLITIGLVVFSASLFLWVLIRNAWCSDDSFISMRVVDNFVNGYGLVWNVGERVQVFTHPLWVLLLIPIYKVHRDPYSTLFLVSLTISFAGYILLLKYFLKTPKRIVLGTIYLTLSAAFIDYSSSGLENPLSHLLAILFITIWFVKPDQLNKLFWLSLIAGLATVNRYDTILFYIPVIIYLFIENRKTWQKAIIKIIVGFSPLIVWELFSLVYYGFLFPNTYYAKLSSINLPANWHLIHGWQYFKNSFLWDPLTLSTIIAVLVLMFIKPDKKQLLMNAGVVFYLLYVLSIGGDFMSGRFFSIAFIIMFAQLFSFNFQEIFPQKATTITTSFVLVMVITGLLAKFPPLLITRDAQKAVINEYGIANEKLYYFGATSWLNRRAGVPYHEWALQGKRCQDEDTEVVIFDSIGFFGYSCGPEEYIIDEFTLSDPLRARLSPEGSFRIGHVRRSIPDGYIETIGDSFTNHIENPHLHMYYDKLDVLIHQDLFSPGRMREIVNFNIGKYDYLLAEYSETSH